MVTPTTHRQTQRRTRRGDLHRRDGAHHADRHRRLRDARREPRRSGIGLRSSEHAEPLRRRVSASTAPSPSSRRRAATSTTNGSRPAKTSASPPRAFTSTNGIVPCAPIETSEVQAAVMANFQRPTALRARDHELRHGHAGEPWTGGLDGDFRVEMSDPGPVGMPVAGTSQGGQPGTLWRYLQVTLTSVGQVRPAGNPGVCVTTTAGVAGNETGRAFVVIGPMPGWVRCSSDRRPSQAGRRPRRVTRRSGGCRRRSNVGSHVSPRSRR